MAPPSIAWPVATDEGSPAFRTAVIAARLDRLPVTRCFWQFVTLLALASFFDNYQIYQTAFVSPGLIRDGIFSNSAKGLWGMSDQAIFASANFAGLFIGTMFLSAASDWFGRRRILIVSMLWMTAASLATVFQTKNWQIDLLRFIGGVGVGMIIVTANTYMSELVPKTMRTKAFAYSAFIGHLSIPVLALLSWLLIPERPFGFSGWRWVVAASALGAGVAVLIKLFVPESPRWLARVGRFDDAERIVGEIEARVSTEARQPLTAPPPPVVETKPHGRFSDIFRPPYRRRTIMLSVFSFFQTVGAYGFSNWLPAFLAARGASFTHSLQYSFIIALAYPCAGILMTGFAGKFELKWQIVVAALGIAVFGILFSLQSAPALLIVFGVLITFSNFLLGFSFHNYQAELFPTGIRARGVGFCYSWSRLSVIFSSFMIAFCLEKFGVPGVFVFIASGMLVVVLSISIFGPKTRNLSLEEISH